MTKEGDFQLITIMPALVGLMGVCVGAVITAGANYVLAVRKEKVEEAKDKVYRINELKTAARLIENEFSITHTVAELFVTKRRRVVEMKLPLDAWEKCKEIVARELPVEKWNAVKIAAITVELHKDRAFCPMEGFTDDQMKSIVETDKMIMERIKAGMEALGPYM